VTRKHLLAVVGLVGIAASAAVPAQAGTAAHTAKAQRKSVKVLDNYYSPGKLTVPRNSAVRFVWTNQTADIHDVALVSGPRGVRKSQFTSDAAGPGYVFQTRALRRLTRPGTYRFLCTFHEADGMKFTLVVRRK
jgi:plastocyanin